MSVGRQRTCRPRPLGSSQTKTHSATLLDFGATIGIASVAVSMNAGQGQVVQHMFKFLVWLYLC